MERSFLDNVPTAYLLLFLILILMIAGFLLAVLGWGLYQMYQWI